MIIFVILAYVAVQIAIAAWAARDTKSDADYLVAGRKLGTFAVAMSVFATWFASETVIATSSEVAAFGMAGARIEPFAFGLGILVLGLFVAGKLRAGGHITLADYLGTKFGPRTEALSALTIAASGTMWAGAQLYALATIISASSGISFELALGASTAIVLTYTLLGGLVGDVVTDVIQGIILIIGMGILLVLIVVAAGGWGAAVSSIPAERWRFSGEDETWLDQIDIWIIPIIGSIVSQEAISRTLGAKSVSVARNGAIIGSLIYMAVGLLPVAFGLFGPHLGITL
ncbi:MAG: sodium:solute symporter, partial [Pseudomonadota bacterium]